MVTVGCGIDCAATFESQGAGRAKTASGGTVSAEKAGQALARLWANLGGRRTVRTAWDPHQPRDAAPLAHRGQAMAAAAGTCGTSPCVASAACALWRTGAMGHQGTQLAGRARREAV